MAAPKLTTDEAITMQRESAPECHAEPAPRKRSALFTILAEGVRRTYEQPWPALPSHTVPMGAPKPDHLDMLMEEFDLQRFIAEARNNAPESSVTPSETGMRALVFYLAKQLFETQRRLRASEKAIETLHQQTTGLVALREDLITLASVAPDLLSMVAEADTLPGCGSED